MCNINCTCEFIASLGGDFLSNPTFRHVFQGCSSNFTSVESCMGGRLQGIGQWVVHWKNDV